MRVEAVPGASVSGSEPYPSGVNRAILQWNQQDQGEHPEQRAPLHPSSISSFTVSNPN